MTAPQDIEHWSTADYAAAVRRLLSWQGPEVCAACPAGTKPEWCDEGRVRRVVLRKLLNNLGVLAARQVGCASRSAAGTRQRCASGLKFAPFRACCRGRREGPEDLDVVRCVRPLARRQALAIRAYTISLEALRSTAYAHRI